MYQITTEQIPAEIIDQYVPQEIKLKDKLIRKINESYQYNSECFEQVSKGNYSFIEKLVESHIFHYC